MSKIFQFGEDVDGFKYKVLDERTVRANAGITFLLGMFVFINGIFFKNYQLIPYVVGFILLNFIVAVFVNPKFSLTTMLAKFIVSGQEPDYVGAIQKRFAWSLGIVMSAVGLYFALNITPSQGLLSPLFIICMTCLTFMFMEAAFGICVGCKIYGLLLKLGIMKQPESKEHQPKCPGNVCQVELDLGDGK